MARYNSHVPLADTTQMNLIQSGIHSDTMQLESVKLKKKDMAPIPVLLKVQRAND